MADRLMVEELGRLNLFAGLSDEALGELSALSEVRSIGADERVFEEGDPPGELFVVLEGRITLCMRFPGRPDTSFLSLRPGELLGWSSLLARPRVATARVTQTSRLLVLPASGLLELCETNHDVGYVIMTRAFEEMADRLQTTRLQLLDMFGKSGS